MNTIKTKEDVLEWAKMIVAAKGAKYTPLAKGDMFAIANFIVETACLADATQDRAAESKEATKPPKVGGLLGAAKEKKKDNTSADKENGLMMTRSELLHREGCAVQQAYDKFLKWSKDHPKESTVMDFSTGEKSHDAAFAYWLTEVLAV